MAPANYQNVNIDFHLLKRKTSKGKTVYYAAFLSDLIGKNGKPKYQTIKSTGQGNRVAAEKVARSMLADGKVLASGDSLRTYLLNFWNPEKSEYLRSQVAEGRKHNSIYLQNNKQRIKQYVLPYFEKRGIKKLSDLDRKNILSWRNYLFEHGKIPEYEPPVKPEGESRRGIAKRPSSISPSTQNKVRQAFFVALQWAVDMGMLPYHPGSGVKRVKEIKVERQIFQITELEKLFNDPWDDIRAYCACLLAVTTGARLGEVRGLKLKNIHLKNGYIDILTNYVEGDGLKGPKWESERVGVPIPDVTIKAIRAVLKTSPYGSEPESFAFYSTSSMQYPADIKLITDGLKKRMKIVGISNDKTFHSFRHTYVSHLRGSISEAKLTRLVGHTNTAITDRYTHTSEEDLKVVRDAVSSIIRSKH